jgi:hypothetical protein
MLCSNTIPKKKEELELKIVTAGEASSFRSRELDL